MDLAQQSACFTQTTQIFIKKVRSQTKNIDSFCLTDRLNHRQFREWVDNTVYWNVAIKQHSKSITRILVTACDLENIISHRTQAVESRQRELVVDVMFIGTQMQTEAHPEFNIEYWAGLILWTCYFWPRILLVLMNIRFHREWEQECEFWVSRYKSVERKSLWCPQEYWTSVIL